MVAARKQHDGNKPLSSQSRSRWEQIINAPLPASVTWSPRDRRVVHHEIPQVASIGASRLGPQGAYVSLRVCVHEATLLMDHRRNSEAVWSPKGRDPQLGDWIIAFFHGGKFVGLASSNWRVPDDDGSVHFHDCGLGCPLRLTKRATATELDWVPDRELAKPLTPSDHRGLGRRRELGRPTGSTRGAEAKRKPRGSPWS